MLMGQCVSLVLPNGLGFDDDRGKKGRDGELCKDDGDEEEKDGGVG